MKKTIINTNFRSYQEIKKDYVEYLQDNNYNKDEIQKLLNDTAVYNFEQDNIEMNFNCELSNLDINLDNNIIAIVDIGTWQGRAFGYKILKNNLKEILLGDYDNYHVFYNTKNRQVEGIDSHHDGTNYITFRKYKYSTTDEQKELLENAIYENKENVKSYISRYTESLAPFVKKSYG